MDTLILLQAITNFFLVAALLACVFNPQAGLYAAAVLTARAEAIKAARELYRQRYDSVLTRQCKLLKVGPFLGFSPLEPKTPHLAPSATHGLGSQERSAGSSLQMQHSLHGASGGVAN